MDKYEYNVKLEQIKKLIRKKDYATAAKIADTIDWYRVKNNQTIVLIADVYEASGRYAQAKSNLKIAYDRSGLGRQIAFKLVKVCIKCGDIEEAEDFYDDFVSAAPRDISKYLLQYELAKAKGEPLDKQISILEQYLEDDMDDRWAFELAKLYHKSGQRDKCIEQCDTVMLWFSDGRYVDKAMDLKMIYTPLSPSQQQRYEARWKQKSAENNLKIEEIKVKEVDVQNKYNTQNIQEALKESMDEIFSKEKADASAQVFKPAAPSDADVEKADVSAVEVSAEVAEEPVAERVQDIVEAHDEAGESATNADDYIYRMAANMEKQEEEELTVPEQIAQAKIRGMETVPDDEFEEAAEADDLENTKVFQTTRSIRNMGDTKIFNPKRVLEAEAKAKAMAAIAEGLNLKAPKVGQIDLAEKEVPYILEEKTIRKPAEEVVEVAEEITEGTAEEPVEEVVEEVAEETVEEPIEEVVEEVAEETVEEPIEEVAEEAVEELVEEVVEEVAEETAEEPVEEVAEEAVEEPVEEVAEEAVEEPVEEVAEETAEEPIEEATEKTVEEPVEEVDEEAVEEPVEEVAEEAVEQVVAGKEETSVNSSISMPNVELSAVADTQPEVADEQIEGQMTFDDFFNAEGNYEIPSVEEDVVEEINEEIPEPEEEEVAAAEEEITEIVEESIVEESDVVEETEEELEVTEEPEAEEEPEVTEDIENVEEPEVVEEADTSTESIDLVAISSIMEEEESEETEQIAEFEVEAEESEQVAEAEVEAEDAWEEEDDGFGESREEIDPFVTLTNIKLEEDYEEDSAVTEDEEETQDGIDPIDDEEEVEEPEEEEEDEDEPQERALTNQEIKDIIKDFIGKYSGVQGLDKQMLKTLQNVIVDDNCNIFIVGDAKSGKTSLGIDIIKVVNKIKRNNNRRIAKISADKLIGKDLDDYFARLEGSDLFVENICQMDDFTLDSFLKAIDNDMDDRIIVIEDEKVNADKLLAENDKVREYFINVITVRQNKIRDWVAVAEKYAGDKGYEIDEMGTLALHAKIDQLYGITLVIQKNQVEGIIDNAIKKFEKVGLLKKLFGNKNRPKVLTEEHFS